MRRSAPAVTRCGWWCITGTALYVGGTGVPVGFRVYPSHSTLIWTRSLTHLGSATCQCKLLSLWYAPGSCPYVGCCLSDRVTGTTRVPELPGKFLRVYGVPGDRGGILRIARGHTSPRKDGTVSDKATTGCELAEITNVTRMAGAWPHIKSGPPDWRACFFCFYVLETVKGKLSRWAGGIGTTIN
ncbi:hypothetical protein EDB92DRAFT_397197 [Lactarius akahatsu]|uniref:Uncharacterized protein n=1 Tax=Lactarius akahatsu TaxID=416441 RepID=A0AAD4LHF1_9AGAM|nr:hypothetical protein EDB92DRAFT_397197 [Lactarius akahatsu]